MYLLITVFIASMCGNLYGMNTEPTFKAYNIGYDMNGSHPVTEVEIPKNPSETSYKLVSTDLCVLPSQLNAQFESAKQQYFMELAGMDKTEMYGIFSLKQEFTYSKTKLEKEIEREFDISWEDFVRSVGIKELEPLLTGSEKVLKDGIRKILEIQQGGSNQSKAHVVDLETFPIIQTDEHDLKRAAALVEVLHKTDTYTQIHEELS